MAVSGFVLQMGLRTSNTCFAGVSVSSEGPLIFGISRIRGNSPAVDRRVRFRRFLVTTKSIDTQLVDQVSLLSRGPAGVSFSREKRTGPGNLPIVTYAGQHAGTLRWTPDFSGSQLRRNVLPWLVLLIVVILGMAAGVLWRTRVALRLVTANQVRSNYLAEHDALTGLPNRRAFLAHLENFRFTRTEYVLFFLDLDGFKEINDTFGHGAGDALLRKTGQRLSASSPDGAYVARLGGDEFAVVVANDLPRHALEVTATRLATAVREPYEFGGAPTVVGVSIGVALSNRQKPADVVRHADCAMYDAKAERRDGWKVYSCAVEESKWTRKEMENDLRCALADG